VVSSTPRPHFTPDKDPVPIVQEAGWALGSVWTFGKSRPHRDSIPDRPARSRSLYRLSYPPLIYIYIWSTCFVSGGCFFRFLLASYSKKPNETAIILALQNKLFLSVKQASDETKQSNTDKIYVHFVYHNMNSNLLELFLVPKVGNLRPFYINLSEAQYYHFSEFV